MEVDRVVNCSMTGQNAEYEYDIENTLMNFILDVNSDTPSLGFKPSEVSEKTNLKNAGVFVEGTGFRFEDNNGKTLAELGVSDGSLIVITEDATVA